MWVDQSTRRKESEGRIKERHNATGADREAIGWQSPRPPLFGTDCLTQNSHRGQPAWVRASYGDHGAVRGVATRAAVCRTRLFRRRLRDLLVVSSSGGAAVRFPDALDEVRRVREGLLRGGQLEVLVREGVLGTERPGLVGRFVS